MDIVKFKKEIMSDFHKLFQMYFGENTGGPVSSISSGESTNSIFDMLPDEIILHICHFLQDKYCLRFLSTCKYLNRLVRDIVFTTPVKLKGDLILHKYYDNFSIIYDAHFIPENLPKKIKILSFGKYFNSEIKNKLPEGITHLSFGYYFDRNIKGIIPNTVTHLKFGMDFNQDINGAIPDGVVHLTFGTKFDQDISGAIPHGVTHLIFGNYFNRNIRNKIPNTVTHLILGRDYDKDLGDAIPHSVKFLTLPRRYPHKESIPKFIEKITYI